MIDKKQLSIILAKNIAIIVLTVVIASLAVFSIAAKMTAVRSLVVVQKKQALEMSRRGETYAKLQSDFSTIGDAEAKIAQALPLSDDISEFVSFMNSFGTQNGVNQSVHFTTSGARGAENGVAAIDYSLGIVATGAQLVSYLQHFERIPYVTVITGLTISSTGSTDIRSGANAAMPAQLFVQPND